MCDLSRFYTCGVGGSILGLAFQLQVSSRSVIFRAVHWFCLLSGGVQWRVWFSQCLVPGIGVLCQGLHISLVHGWLSMLCSLGSSAWMLVLGYVYILGWRMLILAVGRLLWVGRIECRPRKLCHSLGGGHCVGILWIAVRGPEELHVTWGWILMAQCRHQECSVLH